MKILKSLFLSLILFLVLSCSSSRPHSGYDFMKDSYSISGTDSSYNNVYITGTKSVDSINPKQVLYDIFRLDYSKYPDQIQFYSRPYDSSGNFINQMAFPYKTNDSINYFTRLDETLGESYRIRNENVPRFTVREYGAGDSIAFNIQLTLDYSGSVSQIIDVIFEATEIFVSLKLPEDKIGINSFNQKFDKKVEMDKDGERIISLYRAKKTDNYGLFSAIYDACWNSLKQFEGTDTTKPRILVLFTDGDDNYSQTRINEIIPLAKELNVNIFTIAMGYSQDDNLRYMAEYTGGRYYKAQTKEELVDIFRDIYNSLRNYYLITYTPPKYWGWHTALSTLSIPGMDSAKVASSRYNTSDLTPWSDLSETFKRPILFEFDSSRVLPKSFYILDEITDAMMTIPKLRLEIQGHTDNLGTIEYNQELSERRAEAVQNALVERGIAAYRLRFRGLGMSRPIATNETEDGQAKNRRTEFVIIAK